MMACNFRVQVQFNIAGAGVKFPIQRPLLQALLAILRTTYCTVNVSQTVLVDLALSMSALYFARSRKQLSQ